MEITRRGFIKSASLLAATIATSKASSTDALATVSSADYGIERKVFMACRMCAQFCPMVGYVRDGRLIKVEANHNTPYPAICGRGKAAIGALYDSDRIKSPLIRTGERGKGEFREATWDEALGVVAGKMKELKDNNEAHKLAYMQRFNAANGLDDYLISCYGTPNIFSYADSCFASANEISFGAVYQGGAEPRAGNAAVMGDYENSKLAVLIGRNPAGGLVAFPWGAMYGRGRKNGLKTILIDPRKPAGTGETDTMWLPVIPGTDTALLIGLMNEIFLKKYYDEEYLIKYTNADMLVDLSTLDALKIETAKVADDKEENDYLVYDTSINQVVMKSKAKTPALFGEYTHEGKKVKTGLQMIADSCKDYTPNEAEKVCGVKAVQIEELAKQLNDTKPACFLERGYRTTRYYNSTHERFIIAVINGLLGVYGQKGGLIYGRTVKVGSPLKAPKIEIESVSKYYQRNVKGFELINTKQMRRLFPRATLDEKPYLMKMVLMNGLNPIGGGAGGHEMVKALLKMECIVGVSPFWNESLMYADVILPDTTFMERNEPPIVAYKATFPVIALHQKAVEPLYNCRDGYWIFNQLAKRIFNKDEYDKYFGEFDKGGVEWLTKNALENISGMKDEEASQFNIDALYDNGVWCGLPAGVKPKVKDTPSGKFEVYSLFMARWHKKLLDEGRVEDAKYYSPFATWANPYWMNKQPKLGSDEFVVISGFHPLSTFTGAQTRNNIMLKTIGDMLDYSAVFINKSKGEKLGLKSGDMVDIFNIEIPELIVKSKVVLTNTVNPESLFTFYGVGIGYYNTVNKFLSVASPIGLNPNHIANLTFAPVDGSAPSHDFIVKVRRA